MRDERCAFLCKKMSLLKSTLKQPNTTFPSFVILPECNLVSWTYAWQSLTQPTHSHLTQQCKAWPSSCSVHVFAEQEQWWVWIGGVNEWNHTITIIQLHVKRKITNFILFFITLWLILWAGFQTVEMWNGNCTIYSKSAMVLCYCSSIPIFPFAFFAILLIPFASLAWHGDPPYPLWSHAYTHPLDKFFSFPSYVIVITTFLLGHIMCKAVSAVKLDKHWF